MAGKRQLVGREDAGKSREFDSSFRGPAGPRKCRDVLFLLLFVAHLGGLGFVGYTSFQKGDPKRLLYGYDKDGNLCGTKNLDSDGNVALDLRQRPLLWLRDPVAKDTGLCVSDCNAATQCEYATSSGQEATCYPNLLSYNTFLNRCIPETVSSAAGLKDIMDNQELYLNQMLGAITSNIKTIGTAVACAVGLSLLWILFMRFFISPMVWTTVILSWTVLGGTTFVGWAKSGRVEIPEFLASRVDTAVDYANISISEDTAFYAAIALSVVFGLYTLVLLFIGKRIRLAVNVIKEAARCVGAVPSVLVFPLYNFFFLGGFLALWGYFALYLFSAGSFDPITVQFRGDDTTRNMALYSFFSLLWVTTFINSTGYMTQAGACASWYFTMDKKQIPGNLVQKSYSRTIRNHLGSIAFGSLIIAIIRFLRYCLNYMVARMKKFNNNAAVAMLVCCINYCVKCFERFIEFINKNAYIIIAIHGYSFCKAAKDAFFLILRNVLSISTLNVFGDFILFIGKITVAGLTTAGTVLYLTLVDNEVKDVKNMNLVLPALLVFVASYAIASTFLGVFECAIDTIFVCFCEDSERNDGSAERPYYMPSSLKALVKSKGKSAKRRQIAPA